ncbi:hypothetical protein [Defluviimonas sp. SAOS-178_SWC]|uniref:hypothetical protein n=1 Tax=Defluviimonas sp. SAOS-178_SWC TaxID=3121287 RepID=UPI0032216156
MSVEGGTSDFIGRVRQRHQAPEATRKPETHIFVVHVTRDGKTVEDLLFDRAPSIGAIAARVGTEAYVISLDMIERRPEGQLAAE